MTGPRSDPAAILVINAGSSSIKFALYALAGQAIAEPVAQGELDGIGAAPRLKFSSLNTPEPHTRAINLPTDAGAHAAALDVVLSELNHLDANHSIIAVGHRVVHGGADYSEPAVITAEVMHRLEELMPLAPLHQPHNLAAIRAMSERLPMVMQVACFDTAFHRTCPPLAQRFALPRAMHDKGIRRYGFHGLSYEYIAHCLPLHTGGVMPPRVVVAHLGAGASLCAMKSGYSVATTMGFTALEGLMMGTRCGAIDPGVILHLMEFEGMSLSEVSCMLYRESGLLGVSGISADMRVLTQSTEPHAAEAIELFCYRVVREIGSLIPVLGGLDGLVFTAGIGEHASSVRSRICGQLGWLGIALDEGANEANSICISTRESRLPVWVIPTDEQGMIARHTRRLVAWHGGHQALPTCSEGRTA